MEGWTEERKEGLLWRRAPYKPGPHSHASAVARRRVGDHILPASSLGEQPIPLKLVDGRHVCGVVVYGAVYANLLVGAGLARGCGMACRRWRGIVDELTLARTRRPMLSILKALDLIIESPGGIVFAWSRVLAC